MNSENDTSATIGIVSNVLGSATAGILGRVVTHPLDTAKARLQSLNGASYRGPLDVLLQTFRSEGIQGLYRGFPTVIAGGTPGTILYLCGYDFFKEQLSPVLSPANHKTEESFAVHFTAGLLAEAFACVIYVPVDVIKERLQIQYRTDSLQYKGGWDALQNISKTEGWMGIYKGYGATLASFGPFSALYFVFYEKFKLWSRDYHQTSKDTNNAQELSLPLTILSSASAGALASFLTSPLDMAKLRLQVQRGSTVASSAKTTTTTTTTTTNPSFRGMSDALVHSYRSGGIRGLFRGAGARVLHFVPLTTVIMTSYETCRSFVHKSLT